MNRPFSKVDITEGQQTNGKKLNITHHQGNTNQNHNVRMVKIKNSRNKCWQGCGQKGTFMHCWWECRHCEKQQGGASKELKIELPDDPRIPLLRIHDEYKNTSFKGYMHHHVYRSIIYNSQIMETARVHQQMNGQRCNSMDRSREYNAKRNKSEKERSMISLICGI